MKIIAFPFAGGNIYSFRFLENELLAKGISIEVIEYPGRGNRIVEPLSENIDAILKEIMPQVIQEISNLKRNEPYILYGHSMGALMSYLVAIELMNTNLTKPLRLVVSGKSAPSVPYNKGISKMTSKEFWDTMQTTGGTPKELLNSEMLREFYEPIIKSDYKAVENYQYQHDKKLNYPIDIFYGNDDVFPLNDMKPWNNETIASSKIYGLSGGHFFIYDHVSILVDYFTNTLKST